MKMKLALFLFLLPSAASAFSCGGALTKSHLGEKDIRYDKEASNALTDQAPVYRIQQGHFNCTAKFYDAMTGLPLVDGSSLGCPDLKVFPLHLFINNTIIGSRFYGHDINVFENVNQGGPGFAVPQEAWATSSYEKDGSRIQIGTNADFTDVFKFEGRSNTCAVDDRTICYSTSTVFADSLLSVANCMCAWMMSADSCLETKMLLWILVPLLCILLRPHESVTRSTPPRNGFRLFKSRMLPTMSLKLGEM
jgi:hypothetical protein